MCAFGFGGRCSGLVLGKLELEAFGLSLSRGEARFAVQREKNTGHVAGLSWRRRGSHTQPKYQPKPTDLQFPLTLLSPPLS